MGVPTWRARSVRGAPPACRSLQTAKAWRLRSERGAGVECLGNTAGRSSRCSPWFQSAAGRLRSRTSELHWLSTPRFQAPSRALRWRRPQHSGRHGIAVVPLDPLPLPAESTDRRVDAALAIQVAEPDPDAARAWSSPFGSIRFMAEGKPEPTIFLYYDVIRLGLNSISIGGVRQPQWPRAIRDRVLGRMIGRVVAHEIGHWLLRSRHHSTAGLMRAHQTTDDLAGPGRGGSDYCPPTSRGSGRFWRTRAAPAAL